jgi:hypothetical protein
MHRMQSNRGSALIVAMIFAAILAISLTSYLKLSIGAGTLANRSFYMNAAQNLLDVGLERALWSLNNAHLYASPTNWTTGGFAGRTGFTNEYQGTFPSATDYYEYPGNVKGQVKVWVGGYNATNQTWHAVAQATMTLGDGSQLTKMSECYLQQRSYSDRGMVARNGISFNGNVVIDSWKSRDPLPTSDVPYSTAVRRLNATVASPSLISVQQADVYGYVAIGTSTITSAGLTVGANGRIRGVYPGTPGIDTSRVTCDFTASFPDVLPGATGSTIATISTTQELTSGTYNVPAIDLNGSGKELRIGESGAANVILTVNGNVVLTGGALIKIWPGSSLRVYVSGDVQITGNAGIQNGTDTVPNNPDCFTMLGLRTEAQIVAGALMQDWDVQGTSYLSCVIFAPNANIAVWGTGDTYGSIVGNYVDMRGSGNFHQDESLENNRISGLWKLLKWRELFTATERTSYASELAF